MEHHAPDAPVVRFGIKHFAAGSRRLAERGLDHREEIGDFASKTGALII